MTASLKLVMMETLPYIWWKHRIQPLLPREHLVSAPLEGVRRAVHVESFMASKEWAPFLRKHAKRLRQDQLSFCKYTVFACLLEFTQITNPFDRYIRVMALAAYFALYLHARGITHGIAVLPSLLQNFIESEMSEEKVDKDFWTLLSHHIVRKGYLQHHLVVDKMLREGCTHQEILAAIAQKSTIANLDRNAATIASIGGDYIEERDFGAEMLWGLGSIKYQPEPREYSQKMSMTQKRSVTSRLDDDLKKVSQKMVGLERLMKKAKEDVEYKFNFRKAIIEAPLMEEVPANVILDALFNIGDNL